MTLYSLFQSLLGTNKNKDIQKEGLGCLICKYYVYPKCTHMKGPAIYAYYDDRSYLESMDIVCENGRSKKGSPFTEMYLDFDKYKILIELLNQISKERNERI